MIASAALSVLLLCVAGATAQNATCECGLLVDEELFLVQLESLSTNGGDTCTVDDERACAESCISVGEDFDQNFNLSASYPNDAEGRTYGQVYCSKINETLGEEYIAGIWPLNTESYYDGEPCLFPTFWQPVYFHTETLCCDPDVIYQPTCGF